MSIHRVIPSSGLGQSNIVLALVGITALAIGILCQTRVLSIPQLPRWTFLAAGVGVLSVAVIILGIFHRTKLTEANSATESSCQREEAHEGETTLARPDTPITDLPAALSPLQALFALAGLPETTEAAAVTSLNLSGKELTTVPEGIRDLPNLTTLILRNNRLATLPDWLGNLTSLTELYLPGNQLTALPEWLGNLDSLQFLTLKNNQLTSLPESIGNLTSLTSLDVQYNQLTTLPDCIGNLTKLTLFYLRHNQLTTLPDCIGNLTKLTQFHLGHNQLTTLPDCIGNLHSLTYLNLGHNQFTTLPESLGSLVDLLNLTLDHNELSTIPVSIGGLHRLEELTIDHNPHLTQLPLSLGQCSELTHVSTEGTGISDDDRDQILTACRSLRGKESAAKLPNTLKLWCTQAKRKRVEDTSSLTYRAIEPLSKAKIGDLLSSLDPSQKSHHYEWIVRLERTQDFASDQATLCYLVCQILQSVMIDAAFRNDFFNLIAGDLRDCGNRAAASLDTVYVEWLIHTSPEEVASANGVELLVGYARTHLIRREVINRFSNMRENVEILLWVVRKLRDELGLISAISYLKPWNERIGGLSDDVLAEIREAVEKVSTAELIHDLDAWQKKVLQKDQVFMEKQSRLSELVHHLMGMNGEEDALPENFGMDDDLYEKVRTFIEESRHAERKRLGAIDIRIGDSGLCEKDRKKKLEMNGLINGLRGCVDRTFALPATQSILQELRVYVT